MDFFETLSFRKKVDKFFRYLEKDPVLQDYFAEYGDELSCCALIRCMLCWDKDVGYILKSSLTREVLETRSEALLLRAEGSSIAMMSQLLRVTCGEVLQSRLFTALAPLCASHTVHELDPARLRSDGGEDSEAVLRSNREYISAQYMRIFDALLGLLSSSEFVSERLTNVCSYLALVAENQFPGCGLRTVAAFLFLRIFVPLVVDPTRLGLRPTQAARRDLVLVGKLLQATANQVALAQKEPYLLSFSELVEQQTSACHAVCQRLTLSPTGDRVGVDFDGEMRLAHAVSPTRQNLRDLDEVLQWYTDHECPTGESQMYLLRGCHSLEAFFDQCYALKGALAAGAEMLGLALSTSAPPTTTTAGNEEEAATASSRMAEDRAAAPMLRCVLLDSSMQSSDACSIDYLPSPADPLRPTSLWVIENCIPLAWKADDVRYWVLRHPALVEAIDALRDVDVDGVMIMSANAQTMLEEWQVQSLGLRKRMIKAISALPGPKTMKEFYSRVRQWNRMELASFFVMKRQFRAARVAAERDVYLDQVLEWDAAKLKKKFGHNFDLEVVTFMKQKVKELQEMERKGAKKIK